MGGNKNEKLDFRHHLLSQIEMLRGELSHQELSERLGDIHERMLARYIAGRCHLTEADFREVAKALGVDSNSLARAWASSLGLSVSGDPVTWMVREAHMRWRKSSRIFGVPARPSPMAVIRALYADRLSPETPPLWFGAHFLDRRRKDTPENRARFARAYEMLVESVQEGRTARDIGARRGISGERARQLMADAAYTWARSEQIDLLGESIGFKNEALFVKQLYAGLQFFAQQKFHELAKEAKATRTASSNEALVMMSRANRAAFERYVKEHQRCLGIAVYEARTERNLSLDEVAKLATMSTQWLKKFEANQIHTNYSIGRLDRIAQALGVDLSALYTRAGELTGPPPWIKREVENER